MRSCRKLAVVVLAGLLGTTSASWAGDWRISLEGWSAFQSRFDENPGPETAGHVWGEFGTQYLTGTAEYRIIGGLLAGVTAGYLVILDNTMYLHSNDTFTHFNGDAWQVVGNAYYRFWESDKNYADIGAGYQYVSAVKRFFDFTTLGTVTNPGNWGTYKINYSGAIYVVRGQLWPLADFGLSGCVTGSPVMVNATEVSGYGPVLQESAVGLRYRLEGALLWAPAAGWQAALGYRYEDLYFQEPSPTSFDLSIIYGGPFLSVAWTF